MTQYKRKSIIVEAQQWFPGMNIEEVTEIPPNSIITCTNGYIRPMCTGSGGGNNGWSGILQKGTENIPLNPGDWIIRYNGVIKKVPAEQFIFEYEKVEDKP